MDEFGEEQKSKTQLKKESNALQDVGVALTKLPKDKLARIPLSNKLREAVLETSKIQKRGALRRHIQYIGKLMRQDDNEQIVEAYLALQQEERNDARQFHQIELWRNELLSGDKDKLDVFLKLHPQADRQQLNQLIRNCQKEISQQKNSGGAKKLFRFIRDLRTNS